jgi:hypothetical protein
VLEVDEDELLDSAGAAVLVGTGAEVIMISVVIGHVDMCGRVPTAVAGADDNAPLRQTFADGVGETVPVVLELPDYDKTRVVAARVEEGDVIWLEAAADVNVEVLLPPKVLVNADLVTVEGSGVPEIAAPVAPVVERDNVVYWKTKRKINDDLQCN